MAKQNVNFPFFFFFIVLCVPNFNPRSLINDVSPFLNSCIQHTFNKLILTKRKVFTEIHKLIRIRNT